MKTLFPVCVLILLNACGNSNRVELAVTKTPDYLHDIAPFTSDLLGGLQLNPAKGGEVTIDTYAIGDGVPLEEHAYSFTL